MLPSYSYLRYAVLNSACFLSTSHFEFISGNSQLSYAFQEDLVKGGFIVGVLDVTTTELADEIPVITLSESPPMIGGLGGKSIGFVFTD